MRIPAIRAISGCSSTVLTVISELHGGFAARAGDYNTARDGGCRDGAADQRDGTGIDGFSGADKSSPAARAGLDAVAGEPARAMTTPGSTDTARVPVTIRLSAAPLRDINLPTAPGRHSRQSAQNLTRSPPKAASGAPTLTKRGSDGAATPGSGAEVTSPKMPKVAYLLSVKFWTSANSSTSSVIS